MQEFCCSLSEKLIEIVKKAPDKIALQIKKVAGYEKYTYQDVYDYTQKVAKSLVALGIKKNDHVAIFLENRPEWVFIYFGILFAGATVIPLDPQSTPDELKYFLANSASKTIFTSIKYKSIVVAAASAIKTLQNVILLDGEQGEDLAPGVLFFSKFLQHSQGVLENIKVLPSDIASIIYTSGTTGQPKGVMLTHGNFYSNFCSIEKLKIFDQEHNVLSILPLHHSFPFMVTLLIPLFTQSTITYVTSIRQEEIIRCMQEVGITVFVGVPQFFYLFHQTISAQIKNLPWGIWVSLMGSANLLYKIRQLTGLNLSKRLFVKIHKHFGKHLKYFVSGGARLDEAIEVFLNKIGFTLIQGYGLTETSPIVTFNPLNKVKIGSVGKAISGVKIKINEPDEKGIGEIVISGPNVMVGYYESEQETQEVLKDHWFYSGDLGYLDNEGYLFLAGRKKELIKLSNGKNISPEEIETHYGKSPYIKELCVLAIGEGEKEKLVAVIFPDFSHFKKTGELNISETLTWELGFLSKGYPLYKTIMGFVITKEALPRTHLGKLKRHVIKDKYLDTLIGSKQKISQEEKSGVEERQVLSNPICYKIIAAIVTMVRQLERPVRLDDHLSIDLGFDSLTRIELMATLEKQFNISIPEALVVKISTVKELVLAIEQLLSEQKPKRTQEKLDVEEPFWQSILQTDPNKSITDKIDIAPSFFAKIAYLLFSGIVYFITKIMWRFKVFGKENLPQKEPFILCPNHASYLDAFFILTTIPNWLRLKVFFLGLSTFFDVPIIRNLIKIGRILPIDLATNVADAMRACSYVLRHNEVMCIFPEGGRSTDGTLQPFKKGVGILAKELQVKLVPVYIDGSYQVLPRGKFFPSFHKVKVIFGKPCFPDELKVTGKQLGAEDDYQAIAMGLKEKVRQISS